MARWHFFFLFVDVNILRFPKECGGDIVVAELAHDLVGEGSTPATSMFLKTICHSKIC